MSTRTDPSRDLSAALARYRVRAWVTGVMLLVLVLVAIPPEYAAKQDALVVAIGPVHGFLYAVYLLASPDLARRVRWPLGRTVLVLLAGTIPFASFYAEHRIAAEVRERVAA